MEETPACRPFARVVLHIIACVSGVYINKVYYYLAKFIYLNKFIYYYKINYVYISKKKTIKSK